MNIVDLLLLNIYFVHMSHLETHMSQLETIGLVLFICVMGI